MTRCVIYARFSSDMQSAASIDDQVRICTERAQREGWTVLRSYTDRAVSGASLIRPGVQALLADAEKDAFDIVLCEALDRMSRDQEGTAHVYKRLDFLGIRLETLSEGRISELHVGLSGTMNTLFLKELANKTRRGQRGVVESGRVAGGLSYGYEPVRELKADGTVTAGIRKVREDQASVVRRIFADYIAGLSAYQIARKLNAERVPGPRQQWVTSTILGNPRRRNGILNNELYIGKIVWNRQRFKKDPNTSKRVSRPNPPETWIRVDAPHLRIIDDATWDQAQAQLATRSGPEPLRYKRRPKHIFSGLIHCAACAGTYAISGGDNLQCSNYKNAGSCPNKRALTLGVLEAKVLDGLQEEMLSPEAVAAFVRQYHEGRRQARSTAEATRRHALKTLTDVRAKIKNVVAMVEDGAGKALGGRLRELEATEADLETTLATVSAPVIELQPNAVEVYRKQLEDLRLALNGGGAKRQAAIAIVRSMVTRVDIVAPAAPSPMEIVIYGDIEQILGFQNQTDREPKGARSVVLVAGTCSAQSRPHIIKRMRA